MSQLEVVIVVTAFSFVAGLAASMIARLLMERVDMREAMYDQADSYRRYTWELAQERRNDRSFVAGERYGPGAAQRASHSSVAPASEVGSAASAAADTAAAPEGYGGAPTHPTASGASSYSRDDV